MRKPIVLKGFSYPLACCCLSDEFLKLHGAKLHKNQSVFPVIFGTFIGPPQTSNTKLMRISILLLLSLSCIYSITQAQTKDEWEEWEGLFNGMSGNPNLTDTELGFVTSFYQLDVSFKMHK